MDLFLQLLANGLVIGTFYALSALGLTLVFGLMRVVNFAHGELYVVGGLLGWALTDLVGLNFFLTLAVVIVCLAVGGYLIDRLLMARVRGQGEEPTILLTIGLSIFLTNTALLIVGTAPRKVVSPFANKPLFFGPVVITQSRLVLVAISAAVILVAHLLIQRTTLGRSMRATFQDSTAAQLAGIRTSHVYGFTFALGAALAGAAGMLLSSIYVAQATIGDVVSLKAFVVVILGGMGSFASAIVGGLILGI
jgi:branched-chain amino acid transport system permease protein